MCMQNVFGDRPSTVEEHLTSLDNLKEIQVVVENHRMRARGCSSDLDGQEEMRAEE